MSKRVVESEVEILIAAIIDGITAYEREVLAPAGVKVPPPGADSRTWFEQKAQVAARIASHWQRVELGDVPE